MTKHKGLTLRAEIKAALSDGPVKRDLLDLWLCASRDGRKDGSKLTEELAAMLQDGLVDNHGDEWSLRRAR